MQRLTANAVPRLERLVLVVLLVVVALFAGLLAHAPAAAEPGTEAGRAVPSVSAITPKGGPLGGGTRVTVTGVGFTGVRRVLFGSVAGTAVTVGSNTVLKVTAPPGAAGTVGVRVVTAAGTSLINPAARFTYSPAPTVTALSPPSGAGVGDTLVTVTGTGFSLPSTVRFGAALGTSVQLTSATSLTVRTPPGSPGPVPVTVTTRGGTSAAATFTYVASPTPPTVTSVAPDTGPSEGGTTVVVTGSGFTEVTGVLFGSALGTDLTVTTAEQLTVTAPSGQDTVAVRVVARGVTSAPSRGGLFTYTDPPTAGVTQISAGGTHTCAVREQRAFCWGDNRWGQLGDGTTAFRLSPVAVSGMGTVDRVTTGERHACALAGGSVACWGDNEHGQLGTSDGARRVTPVVVSGLPVDIVGLAAGGFHTCAVSASGSAYCWGWNAGGQLGDGSAENRTKPVPVVQEQAAGIVTVSAGYSHTCAVTLADGVFCWGHNASGQLGDASTTPSATPARVTGLPAMSATRLAAGRSHTCAGLPDGSAYCWGAGGRLGDGTTAPSAVPVAVSPAGGSEQLLAAGGRHTCVLDDAALRCWGTGFDGQLGSGDRADALSAQPVQPVRADPLVDVSAGAKHTCAVDTTGVAHCWGSNAFGQLGTGTGEPDRTQPSPISWRARPAQSYVTISWGRSNWQAATGVGCSVAPPEARTLAENAADLQSRGLWGVAQVVINRTAQSGHPCYAGYTTQSSWDDIDRLHRDYGWTVTSQGMNYANMALMTTDAQRYEESAATLPLIASRGFDRGWGSFSYANNVQDAAARALVGRYFSFGRLYSARLNARATATAAPYVMNVLSVNGGRCSNASLPCYAMPVTNDRRSTSPSAITTLLSPGDGQWGVVQFYRIVEGRRGKIGDGFAWDCSSLRWQDRWTSQPELYCRSSFLESLDGRSATAVPADPGRLALEWGRTPAEWTDTPPVLD